MFPRCEWFLALDNDCDRRLDRDCVSGRHAVAARKGHSFFGYFLFSLVFFPAALIVAYMVSDRTAMTEWHDQGRAGSQSDRELTAQRTPSTGATAARRSVGEPGITRASHGRLGAG